MSLTHYARTLLDPNAYADGSLPADWVTGTFGSDVALKIASGKLANSATSAEACARDTGIGTISGPFQAGIIRQAGVGAMGFDYYITSPGASVNGYRLQTHASNTVIALYRVTGGAFTQIGSATKALAVGDQMLVDVSASGVHTVYHQAAGSSTWTQLFQVTDTNHTSGQFGIYIDTDDAATRAGKVSLGRARRIAPLVGRTLTPRIARLIA